MATYTIYVMTAEQYDRARKKWWEVWKPAFLCDNEECWGLQVHARDGSEVSTALRGGGYVPIWSHWLEAYVVLVFEKTYEVAGRQIATLIGLRVVASGPVSNENWKTAFHQ